MRVMPGTLNRYLGRQFLKALAMMIGAVSLILFLADYVSVLRRFSDEKGYTAASGLALSLLHVPMLLDTALPFTFLFAALIALLDLSRKLELVVARASGVSVWGVLRAPFVIALLFGAATTALLNPLAIAAQQKSMAMQAAMQERAASQGGHWFRQEGGGGFSIVHATSTDAGGGTLLGVVAFVYDGEGSFKERVEAPQAEYFPQHWVLADATVTSAAEAPHRVPRYDLPTTLTLSEVRRDFLEPSLISVWSLPRFVELARRTGLNPDPFRVAFNGLISRPFFYVAMIMIAATVSLRLTRYGGTWRFILAGVAIGFLLYALAAVAADLGGNGIIDPALAAWLPPILTLTLGATALLFQEDG
jgi:lipopolysaccharide export system permease protein